MTELAFLWAVIAGHMMCWVHTLPLWEVGGVSGGGGSDKIEQTSAATSACYEYTQEPITLIIRN